MAWKEVWYRRDWATFATLLVLFLLALYLRAYFPWEMALPSGLLSGGSDAFYYERIVNHALETGEQLVFDPRLNYPMGFVNPRPPLYSWSVVVLGKLTAPIVGSVEEAVKISFLSSTAIWGALTIFPTYFLTKEAFGKKAAILAAFFLAFLPAHLARSPATNGDHDAMVLFFVVTGFFFFLKSLKALNEKRWVEDWAFWTRDGRAAIRKGLRIFFSENRRTVLYAMMAGWSFATIALIWQGWAYAPIILLVYILVQVLVHRFRSRDPMGVVIAFGIALGLPLLVALPWYWSFNYIRVWYDVPAYLWLVAMALGIVFVITRDYPWLLVVPSVIGVGAVSLAVASVFYPGIADAFVSGAGYFVRSKAFETIAEAQPPGLSQVILSFGVATYFLALFGLLWMAYGITKRPSPDYLFVVVWAIASIFMAQSAARFIFNASPAFALTSGWVTVLLLNWIKFDDMRKMFRSLGSTFGALRRSVKAGHVLGALVVVFILLVPNVWFAVDAAIPFERKAQYDRQVYYAMPEGLRPAGYDPARGDAFYFGAFGYSLPLEREYFPAAWRWFRGQDADIHPVDRRPAFLSWWDYGFEAVDVGAHPTVADNFLDGYHLAGNFITAQSEAEAIALLNLRLLEGDFRNSGNRFSDPVREILSARGVPYEEIEDAFRRPFNYIPIVSSDPAKYGRYDRMQPQNAQYIFSEEVLTSRLDADGMASLNHAIRKATGHSIRYFAVDTRLFPFDGSNTGIFYAPAKLSDHRILELPDGRSLPRDFFDVIAQTQRGNINLENVKETDTITGLTIRYKEMFYNSMFYRAYVGFPPSAAGQTCDDCIPGLPSPTNQQIAQIPPMQAWNLSHFRLVYKTAYFNPYPAEQVANHTDAWRAVGFTEAQELQAKINRGDIEGVVDLSPGTTIRRGIVFVKYYDGAFVNGTVTLGGRPWPGVRLTVMDEFGIPHATAVSGEDGRYSLLSPFGTVRLIASIGARDTRTLTGPTVLEAATLTVSDAASMREDVDDDGDGVLDWLITHDFALGGQTVEGTAFIDHDRSGAHEGSEPVLDGAQITFTNATLGVTRTVRTSAFGAFQAQGLYPGTYAASVSWRGRTMAVASLAVASGTTELDVAVRPTSLTGYVFDERNARVADVRVEVRDLTNNTVMTSTSFQGGFYAFASLLPGEFEVRAQRAGRTALAERIVVSGQPDVAHNVTVYPSGEVNVRSVVGGPTAFVTLTFRLRSSRTVVVPVTTGADGTAKVSLPEGVWDVSGVHHVGASKWALVGTLSVPREQATSYVASFGEAARLGGKVISKENATEPQALVELVFRSAAGQHRVRTDHAGQYLAFLPLGSWTLQVSHKDQTLLTSVALTGDRTLDLQLERGVLVPGSVLRQFPASTTIGISSPIRDALVRFQGPQGAYETLTLSDGSFSLVLPKTGSYALTISAPGYDPLTRGAQTALLWAQEAELKLVAVPIPVTGTIRLDGVPYDDPTLPLTFLGVIPGTEDTAAVVGPGGAFQASLAPGRYRAAVDRDLSGDGDVRLQARNATNFDVIVAQNPLTLDVELVTRFRVSGTILLAGEPHETLARIEGPDVQEVNATAGDFEVFLADGVYVILANTTQDLTTHLAIHPFTVSGPTTLSVDLLRATNVTGTITLKGIPLASVPIALAREGGGTVEAVSDGSGRYSVYVIGGTYDATIDHATTRATEGGAAYVRYTFSGKVSVAQGTPLQLLPVSVTESLDNATVSGKVTFKGSGAVADIRFVAREGAGVNATARSGSTGAYSLALQPGIYDVYAFAPLERAAFLGPFQPASVEAHTFDLSLQEAHRLSGVTTYRNNARTAANLTFDRGDVALRSTSTAASGYEVYLPPGTYSVRSGTTDLERGITVAYEATVTVALTEATVEKLRLEKVLSRSVDVAWDKGQRTVISPGASVDYTAVVRNTGNVDDTYTVSAVGPDFTFGFSSTRLTIPFGKDNERTVRVTITAKADAKVDHGPITLTASSTAAGVVDSVVLDLDITRYRAMDADVSSDAPTWDGRSLNYTIEVRNRGNGPETFSLTLPNRDELLAAGWRASLVGGDGAAGGIQVQAGSNSTKTVVLQLTNVGGASGALARVHVVHGGDPSLEDLVTVRLQLPSLAVEGHLRATGVGISSELPGLDLATLAFLISIVAVVAAGAYLFILRRRSR